ncbi:MAG: hypothetical protein KGI06_02695 [Candidatus Micrarchaeota archaeon]|nr:hypothetical protein [Candidatus Micrarchaeota archaeon]
MVKYGFRLHKVINNLRPSEDASLLEVIAKNKSLNQNVREHAINRLDLDRSEDCINSLALDREEPFKIRNAAISRMHDVGFIRGLALDRTEHYYVRRPAIRKLNYNDAVIAQIAQDKTLEQDVREFAITRKVRDVALLRKIAADKTDAQPVRVFASHRINILLRSEETEGAINEQKNKKSSEGYAVQRSSASSIPK